MKKFLLFLLLIIITYFSYNYHLFFSSNIIHEIQIKGDFNYSNQKKINNYLSSFVGLKLFEIDLRELKSKLEAHIWIKNAQVIREPPDLLIVKLSEYIPLFLWNKKFYVDKDGVLFNANTPIIDNIPNINSDSTNHQIMYNLYNNLIEIFKNTGLEINSISKNDDMLKISTTSMNFLVRYSIYKEKLKEFVSVYDQFTEIKSLPGDIKTIDLRYPTGFSVH
jgi:cell division septal protein FtsQ